MKLGKRNAKAPSTLPPSHRHWTDQFVAGILSNHSHLHTAGHTSFHAQQHKALCHRADPARLKSSHPLHICRLAAPLSLRTRSCTHIGDPPQTALFSRFSAHDSLRDMAIKTDGLASCKIYSTHLRLKRKLGVGKCVAQPAVVTLCPDWACGLTLDPKVI